MTTILIMLYYDIIKIITQVWLFVTIKDIQTCSFQLILEEISNVCFLFIFFLFFSSFLLPPFSFFCFLHQQTKFIGEISFSLARSQAKAQTHVLAELHKSWPCSFSPQNHPNHIQCPDIHQERNWWWRTKNNFKCKEWCFTTWNNVLRSIIIS